MDNVDIVREMEKVSERVDSLSAQVADLSKGHAVIIAQLGPVLEWVQAQMTNGLTHRMADVERDAAATKAETRVEFQVLRSDIRAIQDQIKYWSGVAAALLFAWGLFGDAVKDVIFGALRKL